MTNVYDIDEIIKIYDIITLCNNEKKITENIKEMKNKCFNCKNLNLINDVSNGNVVCTLCGLVNDVLYDMSQERSNYNDDRHDNTAGGTPYNVLLPQSSLGTSIAGKWTKMKILHNWNIIPYKERSLSEVFKMIHASCLKGNILKCVEDDSKIMFKMISELKLENGKSNITRGKNRLSIIAATLFYACKKKNMMRSPKEIAFLFDIPNKMMTRGCKNFNRMMQQDKFSLLYNKNQIDNYIMKMCYDLKLSEAMIEYGLIILRNTIKLNLFSCNTPLSIAISCLLLIINKFKLPITKKILSKKYHLSEVTIIKTFKKINNYNKILDKDEHVNNVVNIINLTKNNIPQNVLARCRKFGIVIKPL